MTETPPLPNPDAFALAVAIAAHMTGPARWTAHETSRTAPRSRAELRREADGAAIDLVVGGHRRAGRLTLRACWPTYQDGCPYTPRETLAITCDAARDPSALARAIERRLLVDYEPAYRVALAEVLRSNAAASDARGAAERIAVALGAALPQGRPPSNCDPLNLSGCPAGVRRLQIHPAYGDSPLRVGFAVHDLDEPTALRLLAILVERGTR